MAALDSKFRVRIGCFTYNHSKYITDALNGFAMQRTNFPYVCTIIDDASTDGEQEVLKSYLSEHFDLQDTSIAFMKEVDGSPLYFARHKTNHNCHFAVALLRQNYYSQKKSKVPFVADWLGTEYSAICEGDDYWTDPLKLQKQVDYLEAHPDCTLCFTNAVLHWDDESGRPDVLFAPKLEDRDYEGPEMTDEWITPTASLVYRTTALESDFYQKVIRHPKFSFVGDIPLVLTCKHLGKVHGLPDVTCVYRKQPTGFMLSADSNRKIIQGDYRYALYQVFGPEYLESSVNKALYHYRLGVNYAKKEHNWKNYFKLLRKILHIYIFHPICSGKRILKILQERKERVTNPAS